MSKRLTGQGREPFVHIHHGGVNDTSGIAGQIGANGSWPWPVLKEGNVLQMFAPIQPSTALLSFAPSEA